MMGGGSSTPRTEYQASRQGVDRRQYGELGNGFKSQEEYDAFKEFKDANETYLKYKHSSSADGASKGLAAHIKLQDLADKYAFNYDTKYKTYTLDNGVDSEAAITDWDNYKNERIEIATYNAKEDRRKKEPDELQSSHTVDLSIKTDDNKDNEVPTITQSYDTSPSTASTLQPLGIY